jgi:hypothetical protein
MFRTILLHIAAGLLGILLALMCAIALDEIISSAEFFYFSAPVLALALVMFCRKFGTQVIDTGKCAKCGYDLRATPDRCPECGTVQKVN